MPKKKKVDKKNLKTTSKSKSKSENPKSEIRKSEIRNRKSVNKEIRRQRATYNFRGFFTKTRTKVFFLNFFFLAFYENLYAVRFSRCGLVAIGNRQSNLHFVIFT